MKIRFGFISNSSSTSFVVKINKVHKSVRDLAFDMINIRNADRYGIDDKRLAFLTLEHAETGDEEIFTTIKNAIELPKEETIELNNLLNSDLDANTPIAFKSMNYDTYLFRTGDYILVSTCNNILWDDIPKTTQSLSGIDNVFFDKIKSLITKHEFENDDLLEIIEHDLEYIDYFWWPAINKSIKQIRDGKMMCKKKHTWGIELVHVAGQDGLVCPACAFGLYL